MLLFAFRFSQASAYATTVEEGNTIEQLAARNCWRKPPPREVRKSKLPTYVGFLFCGVTNLYSRSLFQLLGQDPTIQPRHLSLWKEKAMDLRRAQLLVVPQWVVRLTPMRRPVSKLQPNAGRVLCAVASYFVSVHDDICDATGHAFVSASSLTA